MKKEVQDLPKGKVSTKEKVFYGMGDMAGNIMLAAISFYLLFFMINVGGVKPALASAIFLIAKLWDAVTDYLMGIISDKTKSKWGKRRVYMLFGALPFGLMFILLWLCPFSAGSGQAIKFVYYLLAYLIFNTTWTIVYVPYNALTANMTNDYDERSSITTVRIIMADVGMLLGAALFGFIAGENTIISNLFVGAGYSSQDAIKYSYVISSAIFGLISAISVFLSFAFVKERVDESQENNFGMWKTIKQFFKMKEFRRTTMYYLLSLIGFDIIMAVFMFFISDTLGYDADGLITMVFVAMPFIAALGTSVMWDKLSEKMSKHKVYTIACVVTSCALLLALFIPQLPASLMNVSEDDVDLGALLTSNTSIMLMVVCVLVGFGMSAVQILPFASIPDVIELDEYQNGVRREGAYYGIQSFMYKLANGLTMALVSGVLAIFGYEENTIGLPADFTQPQSSLIAIRIMLAVVPGVVFGVSCIFAFKSHMGRERHAQIKAELEKRKLENVKVVEETAEEEN